MNAIATWNRRFREWSVDCPNCGRTNLFDLEKPEIPEGFDEVNDKLVATVTCHSCREDIQVFVMVRSRTRSRK